MMAAMNTKGTQTRPDPPRPVPIPIPAIKLLLAKLSFLIHILLLIPVMPFFSVVGGEEKASHISYRMPYETCPYPIVDTNLKPLLYFLFLVCIPGGKGGTY
jgi:hypothetical protein